MTGTTSTTSSPEVPRAAVVVGVDGTDSSLHAAEWAAEHADLEGLPLVVVHTVDDTAVEATAWSGVVWVLPTPFERLMATGRLIVEEATDRISRRHPDLAVHPHVVHGDVRRTLVDLSRDASMVVLGSRGRGTVGSAVLGSVGAHVTRHASSPVVITRPGHPGRVHDGVVVLCDGTPTSVPVVARAIEIAAERGLGVTVVRCVPHSALHDEVLAALEDDLAPLRGRAPGVPVHAAVRVGDPADTLAAWPRPPDLVVVGRHPVDSLVRHLTHVNATRVLEHAESPVLVVPQAG
ncbi:universal stress protein [Nocardioides aestuarii]|uniref:Universal stress protein n=1 Tax=Nocardioides aestuarii TaxID=252231 RepID=A0ABW4TMR9_9ACTN